MIYRLEIENFSSIRNPQVLDLTIAPNVPDIESRFAPIFEGSKLRAPKIVALFGANASGKTTVLRALQFILNLVRDSAQWSGTGFPCERFNDDASRSRPIRLSVELGGVMNLSQEIIRKIDAGESVEHGCYRYEVSIDVVDGIPRRISSEALRQKPSGQGKWQRVFERTANGQIKDSKTFSLSGFHHLLNTLRPNVSVIASFALFQHPAAVIFAEELRKALFEVGSANAVAERPAMDFLAASPDVLHMLNKELNRIDVGVEYSYIYLDHL